MSAWTAPGPWHLLVLALAAARITRLVGWDTFPLAVRIREWATGQYWVPLTDPAVGVEKVEGTGRVDSGELGLPGKKPSSGVAEVRVAYRRPVVAHLVTCPFCVGWWISLAVYVSWLAAPRWTLYVSVPLAVSSLVGWASRNLDP